MNFGDNVQIKGCQIKARFLESSSGNTSLDKLLGGALPNSCITILDEPQSRVYAETLTKYFLSEGLYNGHDLLIVDPTCSTTDYFKGLPSKIEKSETTPSKPEEKEGNMKIAWRYGSAPKVNSAVGSENRYDLGKPLTNLSTFDSRLIPADENTSYEGFFTFLKNLLAEDKYSKNKGPHNKNLLRIVIRNLGSPLWSDSEKLSAFLACLQSITRNSYCLVMATTSCSTLSQSETDELEAAADCFFRLVAMSDEEKKNLPVSDKSHGYFHIVRLPRLTSVATHCPSAVDLVFELHRRSFDIKILHLPPAQGSTEPQTPTACSTIDF